MLPTDEVADVPDADPFNASDNPDDSVGSDDAPTGRDPNDDEAGDSDETDPDRAGGGIPGGCRCCHSSCAFEAGCNDAGVSVEANCPLGENCIGAACEATADADVRIASVDCNGVFVRIAQGGPYVANAGFQGFVDSPWGLSGTGFAANTRLCRETWSCTGATGGSPASVA